MSPHALIGQMSVGQVSVGQMSVGQVSVGQMGVGQVSGYRPGYIKGAETTRQHQRGRMAPRKGAKCDVCTEADAYLSICKCCLNKRPEVVDSPLLMYVNTYVTRASRLQLKLAILNHYGARDVVQAKEQLEHVNDLIPEFPHFGKRTGFSKQVSQRSIGRRHHRHV